MRPCYQTLQKIFQRLEDGSSSPVELSNYPSILVFPNCSCIPSAQFWNIDQNFGHRSVENQIRIIEKAGLEVVPEDTWRNVQQLVKIYNACQFRQGIPMQFLLSVMHRTIEEFNHVLQIFIMPLWHANILQIIDTGTRFQNGGFSKKWILTVHAVLFCMFCINIFAIVPDYLYKDAGTNIHSSVFNDRGAERGTILGIAPIEAKNHNGVIKRGPAYLWTLYEKSFVDFPLISKKDRLSLTYRASIDTLNASTGICSVTLVHGNFSKIPGCIVCTAINKKAKSIRDCT